MRDQQHRRDAALSTRLFAREHGIHDKKDRAMIYRQFCHDLARCGPAT